MANGNNDWKLPKQKWKKNLDELKKLKSEDLDDLHPI